jgi:hypothetical protein
MPTYTVLVEFDTVIDDVTREEKKFHPDDIYDGPEARIPLLLAGIDFHGPLIAENE